MKFTITSSKFGQSLGSFEFDTEKLTQAQIDWAIVNGFKQAGGDSHASDTEEAHSTKEKAIVEATASFKAWCDKMATGHVPTTGAGKTKYSPLEKEVRRLCVQFVKGTGLAESKASKMVVELGVEETLLRLATLKVEKEGRGDAAAMVLKKLQDFEDTAKANLAKAQEVSSDFE